VLVEDAFFGMFRWAAYGIGLGPCFALAASLALAGLVAMAWRRSRTFGLVVLGVGASVAWFGLLTISECQDRQVLTREITARFYSYPDRVREAAQLGLLALPAAGWGVKALRDRMERERRRSLISTYLRIAAKAYLDGDYDRAIAEYSIAIKVDPKRTETYVKRGLAWSHKGDYDRAIADFERALKRDPALGTAYLNRGIVLAARGDHEGAIADFDRAANFGATDVAARLHRGLSLAKQGEADRAAADFRGVLRLTNHSDYVEPARFHLAMLQAEGDAVTAR
jgi:tetratricopeptide (TPR) repeat protein